MNVHSSIDSWNVFFWYVKITKDATISFEGGNSTEHGNGAGWGRDGRVDYSGLSYAILHFKQLVDLCSQACRCSLASAAEPAVIQVATETQNRTGRELEYVSVCDCGQCEELAACLSRNDRLS